MLHLQNYQIILFGYHYFKKLGENPIIIMIIAGLDILFKQFNI